VAGSPAAVWLSAVSADGLFLECCAIWDEPDSETSLHPASTKTNKDAASRHPNRILFSRATMVAPSLRVTVCVCYGNQRTTYQGTIPPSRADTGSSMPSTCPDHGVRTSRFEPLFRPLGPPGLQEPVPRLQRHLWRLRDLSNVVGRGRQRNRAPSSGIVRGVT
jgi:hypothetical protein